MRRMSSMAAGGEHRKDNQALKQRLAEGTRRWPAESARKTARQHLPWMTPLKIEPVSVARQL